MLIIGRHFHPALNNTFTIYVLQNLYSYAPWIIEDTVYERIQRVPL